MAEQFDLPFLGEIPIVMEIREGGDKGMPAVVGDDPVAKEAFVTLAKKVAQGIAVRNANLEPTKVVQMQP